MFFYITSGRTFSFPISAHRLSDNVQWLDQAASWTEETWGYLRGFPGIEARKARLQELAQKDEYHFYIITYRNKPIGMFALHDLPKRFDQSVAKELMYFYVDSSFRGLGIGSRMLKLAKNIATRMNADMIVLETMNPNLNKFYENRGASVVAEGQFIGHPTSVLRI